jgi:hypothetical protein
LNRASARFNGSGGKFHSAAGKVPRAEFALILVDVTVAADPREHDISEAGFQKPVRLGESIIEPGAFFKFASIHISLGQHLLRSPATFGPHRIQFKNNSGCSSNRQFDVVSSLSHADSFAFQTAPRYVQTD